MALISTGFRVLRSFEMGTFSSPSSSSSLLVLNQVRYRNRPNLKRPLPMHYARKRMIVATMPVPKPTPPICQKALEVEKPETSVVDENPYALFLAGKLRRDFAKHPMIALFHTDSYTARELMRIRIMLHDAGFPIEIQEKPNRAVVAVAFQNTRWAPVIPLCHSRTAIGYCGTTDIPKFLKLLKKMPAFVLMALVYEGKLLHRDDIDRIAQFANNITTLHAHLSGSLSLPGMQLTQNLMMAPMALTNSLGSYVKMQGQGQGEGSGKSGTASSSSSSSSDSSSSDSDSSSSSSDSDSDSDGEKDKGEKKP